MDSQERHDLAMTSPTAADGVVSRDWSASVGITPDDIASEVRAGRWRRRGNQTVAIHTGPMTLAARRWMAIWETGEKVAALDGVSALQVAGLEHYVDDDVHVSVVHTCSVKTLPGVRLHKVIRRVPGELVGAGIARTRPAVAALRGAYWAVSDRQAALILVMTVQQRLATPEQLIQWSQQLRGRKRRRFIKLVLKDLASGVQSLGELDFAAMCRRRGLPEPSRQVVRRGPRGRIYLDVSWDEWSLVVEIDGAQHRRGLQVTVDNLRQNAVSLRRDTVLRIDIIGLRLCEDEFMDQVAMGLGRISRVS
jgi:very-short-patch-repair endonuclease